MDIGGADVRAGWQFTAWRYVIVGLTLRLMWRVSAGVMVHGGDDTPMGSGEGQVRGASLRSLLGAHDVRRTAGVVTEGPP